MAAITYFDMAENDYHFLVNDYKQGRVGNVLCYAAQSICERYLKHLIDKYYSGDENTTDVLHTHSIRMLRKFICSNLVDFKCDWSKVILVDGYYFSARYPGEDSFIVDREDVTEAWEAVEELRSCVLAYQNAHKERQSADIVAEQHDNEMQ